MEPRSRAGAAWGAAMARHRWWVVALWVAAVAAVAHLSLETPQQLSPAGFNSDTPASRAAGILERSFPERKAPVLYAVFQAPRAGAARSAYQEQLARWKGDLQRLAGPGNAQVQGPVPGRDGRTAGLFVVSNRTPDQFVGVAAAARSIREPGPARVYLGGPAAVYDTFIRDSESDLRNAEKTSLPLAAVLLLLVFGGLAAAGLPVVTGAFTVTAAVAALGLVARVHTVSVFALNICTILGIGLGIDYSLLVVQRFREELRGGREVAEAVAATTATAGVATLVSGGTVTIGFGALMLFRLNVLWSMGVGGMLVVAISVLASLTLIPALMAIVGRRVDALALPFTRGRDTRRFWGWLAHGVMRRPFVFIGAGLAAVAVVASPARNLDLGVVGTESLPPGDPAVTAQRLAQAELGLPARAPVLVLARGIAGPAQAGRLAPLVAAAAAPLPVAGPKGGAPGPAAAYVHPPYALFLVGQPGPDNSAATRSLLDRLHAIRWPPGVSGLVGGEAAAYKDFVDQLLGDLPRVVGAAIGLTLLLLGIAFRSLALPVKAVVMNLLSVTAALGVLTFVFQLGHFSRQLDFQPVGFIDVTVPPVMFAALFGLSMDYEVFLLSRIREEHLRLGDNAAAVAAGMERTGQIITSAAMILVAVSAVLVFSSLTLDKSLGLTFGAAILLDATLIRLILVPAFMRVLGRLNWWPGGGRGRPAAGP
ncbi:MAG: MMPL family transporter [Candidatus Dormibacterales bacterium]